ncbi:hypothetical protein Tco_0803120 [Tanacetum coccineum]|uniref:Uncharacterized protein n=1 Tax=Tanacetum coccineum TaxID=301880 RepID=A0ABQ5A1L9_9ASTR
METEREEQASMDCIANLYNEVQARIDADHELAIKLNHKEQEKSKHSQLNKRTFEEIQALYIKEQERAANFVPIGSEKDEKMFDKMNKKAAGMDEEEVLEEPDITKVEVKQEVILRKRITIASDEDKEVNYEILNKKYPIIEWKSEYHGIKPQFDETKDLEEININVMLELKLESEEDNTMALELIRFIKKLITYAPCYSNEALAIPEQTATGKEISNPFMAGSLPKTT